MYYNDRESVVNKTLFISALSAALSTAFISHAAFAAVPQQNDVWFQDGLRAIEQAKARKPIDTKAKNVIIFIGDGMSVGTMTASRIYAGQKLGNTGEEYQLSMDTMPHVAMSKTYNTDMQTPDSAGTASAIVTGVKTKAGIISVDDNVRRGFCSTVKGNEAKTLFEMAAEKGKALGVVSTARLTHATPAVAYAHSADRDWESDAAMTNIAKNQGCKDIADQFVNFDFGDGFQVAFGGGRREFMPVDMKDPENADKTGKRKDGRNLITEWETRYPNGEYIYDRKGFDAIDPAKTERVFGLFGNSHMEYEIDRQKDNNEPSLAEMTSKAIDMLSKNKDGYVMMVEAGRIDHAHHAGNAARAFEDTVAYDEAIKLALDKTSSEDTLIIVTADHAHTMIMNGYAERGNPILGLSKTKGKYSEDEFGKKYTTISYGNGPGAVKEGRADVTQQEATSVDYLQQSLIRLGSETHSGEDVTIFARGPKAWLFQGTVEQNYIFHVMNEALELTK